MCDMYVLRNLVKKVKRKMTESSGLQPMAFYQDHHWTNGAKVCDGLFPVTLCNLLHCSAWQFL